MSGNARRRAGRHFLQIPGPTPVPDRILRAMDRPVIDHRGPGFAELGQTVLAGMKRVMGCAGPVVIFPSSGTGAWEAALVNALSPGDTVLMYETGHFASLWQRMAQRLDLNPQFIASDWRAGADAAAIEERLRTDPDHRIKAVCIVHNETSTGCVSDIPAVRRAMDAAGHPALLMVDTISSLGSIDYNHEEWGVDVTVAGSQKGLMLPPGLGFNGLSQKALAAAAASRFPKLYWSWSEMLEHNGRGYFPYTPATPLLFGLATAIEMLEEEGLPNVFARHLRLAEATRIAVAAWRLETLCRNPADYSPVLTAVVVPLGSDADEVRGKALGHFDLSLGTGLGRMGGKVFRIGHLGDTNDLTIIAALAGVEMALGLAAVAHEAGGVQAAMAFLESTAV